MSNNDRITIPLEVRTDADGKKFFIGKIKGPILIDCKEGAAFLVFTSEEGEEELQISNITAPKKDFSKMTKIYSNDR